MVEIKYRVLVDNVVYGENMSLESALILVKGIFEKYFNDYTMRVSIETMVDIDEDEVWERNCLM